MQGLITSQVFVDGFNRSNISPLAQHHACRVSRQDIKKEKYYRDHPKEDKQSVPQTFYNKAEHES